MAKAFDSLNFVLNWGDATAIAFRCDVSGFDDGDVQLDSKQCKNLLKVLQHAVDAEKLLLDKGAIKI